MRRGFLTRFETGDDGTFGKLLLDSGFECLVLELPWRDANADGLSDPKRSCVPAGTYVFRWSKSPKHGECYEATPDDEAPNRAEIQIHSANLAGDVDKGFVAQLEGCIAPGASIGRFRGGVNPAGYKDQRGVTASRSTLKALEAELKGGDVEIQIGWKEGVGPQGGAS